MPSIQSCELSRLDLKGVSLVSIGAGSWPLVCFTADVVDVCAKQTKTTTEFCEFFLGVLGMFERFERIQFRLATEVILEVFAFFVMSMTLESRDLIGGNGLRNAGGHVTVQHASLISA